MPVRGCKHRRGAKRASGRSLRGNAEYKLKHCQARRPQLTVRRQQRQCSESYVLRIHLGSCPVGNLITPRQTSTRHPRRQLTIHVPNPGHTGMHQLLQRAPNFFHTFSCLVCIAIATVKIWARDAQKQYKLCQILRCSY